MNELMEIDRIDFGKNNFCYHCNRKLIAKSYVVKINGEEVFFGSECIKEHFPIINKDIPNFIRASIDYEIDPNKIKRTDTLEKNNTESLRRIIEYLRLRCELLTDFYKIEDKDITNIYLRHKNSKIDGDDKNYIYSLMEYFDKINPKFGYKNLMACYMAKNILLLWIDNKNDDFAKSIFENLKSKYYLTEKQIIGANNWIKNIKELKVINGKWFYKK